MTWNKFVIYISVYFCSFLSSLSRYVGYVTYFELFIGECERVIRDEYETQDVLILLFYVHIHVNSLPPEQNGHHFANDMFKCMFLNENIRISINISLTIDPKSPDGN